MDWDGVAAVLFDLDGVITPTATVHTRAWKATFDEALARLAGPEERAFTQADYLEYVDGKPRYDGVRSFLRSRDIDLPEGAPGDDPGFETVAAVGNLKNDRFIDVLTSDGVDPYPGSVRFLEETERRGIKPAIVSSSANAGAVLEAAGLLDRFSVRVDGVVARERGIAGKPAPDMFLLAAELVGEPADACVVIEDAVSGVEAGAAGGFHTVIGVAREDNAAELEEAGADVVVSDLSELL